MDKNTISQIDSTPLLARVAKEKEVDLMSSSLSDRGLPPKPRADRQGGGSSIIQFGEGNFLRGFVEWIVQRMNEEIGFNASVTVVKPRPGNSLELLKAQGCRYHVNLQGLQNGQPVDTIEEITCISAAINPYEDYTAFLTLAEDPAARFIVSNTTEAGIAFDPTCRLSDTPPTSYPAKLTQLLYHRYRTFRGDEKKGFIILPCELIFGNGHLLERCVHQYIELWANEFRADAQPFQEWVERACFFCTTLVDRIVPGFPKKGVESLQARLPQADPLLVQAEPYHLWVIETAMNLPLEQLAKEFPAERTDLNVVFTTDESPYHERKVTLLNGPHTVLSPVAFLAGLDIVRDACQHEVVGPFIRRVMYEELLPTLNLPEEELRRFADDVMERFCNPFVDHQLTSIMLNSLPKFQTRDLPGLKTYLERKGTLPKGIVLGLAAICVYYRGGQRADGTPIQPSDDPRILKLLADLWAGTPPTGGSGERGLSRRVAEGVLAAQELIWHEHGDLNAIPGLTDLLAQSIQSILERGMMKTVKRMTNDE